jgi:hypothetical protein
VFVVYGTRLYGEADQVPGVFAVRTRFAHLNYLPLFPTKSFLMFGEDRGVELPSVQWNSALMGWLRAALVIACGGLAIAAMVGSSEGGATVAVRLLMAGACGFAFWFSYRYTRANKERALELCQLAGLPPEAHAEVENHFKGIVRDGDEKF